MSARARESANASRASATDEAGLSLAELLVAIMIFAVLSLVVGGMFVSVTRGVTENKTINGDTRSATNGMTEVARMVRAATENPLLNPPVGTEPNEPAVLAADVRTVMLYAYVNLDSSAETPVKVQFWVNAQNQLVETRWSATTLVNGHWSFSSTSMGNRILSDSLVPGTPIFTYLNAAGTVIAIPSGGITLTDTLRSIKAMTVAIAVRSSSVGSSAVTLKNTVAMPNLGLSRTGTGS
jgi:type II secretory pathway pseudopilin PulG